MGDVKSHGSLGLTSYFGKPAEGDLRPLLQEQSLNLLWSTAQNELPTKMRFKNSLRRSSFVATSVLTLTLRAPLGKAFQTSWVFLQPFCYTAVLGIWCAALWKYDRSTAPETQAKIEETTKSLTRMTRNGLVQVRAFLGKAMRP
jgi:hypothetical protein